MRSMIVRMLGTLAVLAVLLGSTAPAAGAATTVPGRAAVAVAVPAAAATTDYCGTRTTAWVPEGWGAADFRGACRLHDACYSAASSTSRLACDNAFRARLRDACSTAYGGWNPLRYACYGVAWTYWQVVRSWGAFAYAGTGSPA